MFAIGKKKDVYASKALQVASTARSCSDFVEACKSTSCPLCLPLRLLLCILSRVLLLSLHGCHGRRCLRCHDSSLSWTGCCFGQDCTAHEPVMKYVLLQMLLIWHLLRSLACAVQCSSAAHISALSLLHTLRWLPIGWVVWMMLQWICASLF